MNYELYDSDRYRPSAEDAVRNGSYSYWAIQHHLPKLKDDPILELGCGCGSLLLSLRANSYTNSSGVDMSEPLVTYGQTDLGVDIRMSDCVRYLAEDDVQYSAIIGLDIFEHMSAPEQVECLQLARRRMAGNGRLILRTPNPECPLVLSMFYGDSTHRTMVAPPLLTYMLREAGFLGQIRFEETRPKPLGKRLAFLLAHRLAVAPVIRCLYYLYYGHVPAVLTPNYYCFAYAS